MKHFKKLEVMEAEPGETVDAFAARMVVRSWQTGAAVIGGHNQHTLECRLGMTREQVLAPWHDAQRKSYLYLGQ
jgi:hypothetical protein